MTSILDQVGTKVGAHIKSLDLRMTSAEAQLTSLGAQVPPPTLFTINPVTWANMTEINVGGEQLVNGDFSQSSYVQDPSYTFPAHPHTFNPEPKAIALDGSGGLTQGEIYNIDRSRDTDGALYFKDSSGTGQGWHGLGTRGTRFEVVVNVPTSWSLTSGTLDDSKLSQGIIKGSGGSVAIEQMFASPIPINTQLVVKAERADTNSGTVYVSRLRANGTPYGSNVTIDGSAEFTTSEATYGLRLSTSHGNREVSSLSLFQGAIAGGSVQITTGSIEKISGAVAFNAGASSSQVIGGQQDGYVQFQVESVNHAIKVGLVYADEDYDVDAPYFMKFGSGAIDFSSPWIENHSTFVAGDWFRIRHYSSTNQIHFQKKQPIYGDDLDFCLNQACGLNPTGSSTVDHIFDEADRPLIQAKQTVDGMTAGEYYRIYKAKIADVEGKERGHVYTLDGTLVAWIARRDGNNTSKWEVQQELGEDYQTLYTHPTTTNGGDLKLDVSFSSLGGKINDAQIATIQ